MKKITQIALLAGITSLTTLAASAKSLETEYLESCRKESNVPVPVTVVSPIIASQYAGQYVKVEFTVDASGLPVSPTLVSPADATLTNAVLVAVRQWRFAPALFNGVAVATKVVLPIHIMGSSPANGFFAAK